MANKSKKKCLVVFSGGQDSTICLHWAQKKFSQVHALFFNYGQRHKVELASARKIARKCDVPLEVLKLNLFKELGGNSLTDSSLRIKPGRGRSLPNTFVPGRNIIFLSSAAAVAWNLGIQDLITGVCQTDFSGYPDCRLNTIQSLEKTLSLGMDTRIVIHTPLMHLSKAESLKLAGQVGAMESLAFSHTCYQGEVPPCGKCPSCRLRAKGFKEARLKDPLVERFRISH